ncbi:MAG TPA: PilZ domain-containing protein [Phycisphaerales bacterium]|nr:PilZ domain-containing protein [Phycisphaerales bacterium]
MHLHQDPAERRAFPRHPLQRACKIFNPAAQKYISAETTNLSRTGLLLHINKILELKPGDPIHVGIAMKRRDVLLQAKDMIESTVIRVMHTVDDQTVLALKFNIDADALPPMGADFVDPEGDTQTPDLQLAA